MFEIFIYYFRFSGIPLILFYFVEFAVIFFGGYFTYYILNLIFSHKPLPHHSKLFAKRLIFTFIAGLFFSIFIGFFIQKVILSAKISKIIFFSNAFMQIDKLFFRTYVPFWFESSSNPLKLLFDILSPWIVGSYNGLIFLFGLLLFLLFILRPNYFYKASLSFIIVMCISMPLWFLFPAVSPLDAYVNNILHIEISKDIQSTLSMYHPNNTLSSYIHHIEDFTEKNGNKFFAITEMPSMHIAWSILVLYFGIVLWRPLIFFLTPYSILNAIGTVYTLQHYTIDIPAGLIVAIISIWLAKKISEKITPEFFIV